MIKDIELIKRIKNRTLEYILRDFGKGFGELTKMYLSIWDVRNILYKVCKEEAKLIFDMEFK